MLNSLFFISANVLMVDYYVHLWPKDAQVGNHDNSCTDVYQYSCYPDSK